MFEHMRASAGRETIPALTGMRRLLAFVMLCAFTLTVQAQVGQYPPKAPADLAVKDATVDVLGTYDLSGMSESWWQDLSKEINRTLETPGADVEQAMRKVIFLATYYPDETNFNRSSTALYNIYRFDRDESHRIMALAALYANGDENAMRLLAWHAPFGPAPWESSDLVRQLTVAAVAAYYRTPQIMVGPPTAIGEQPENN